MSSSQSKPSLDNMQNSGNSTHSQTKGKKRERGDQFNDPIKRERSSRTDDGDSGSIKIENILRSEAAKLTEKGCLVGFESVEKLVEFIQPNRTDKKLDLVSRSMVAGVIAATDRFDCLSHFVQLKGLVALDEWLQDVHKGRISEINSGSKDCEKTIEDFLLVLLRALDKLPVNLHALQTCNIGRSVNRLRSNRNSDIQRKARNLVDIWKKRVEAEMNVLDGKSGSNQVAGWSSNTKTILNKAVSTEETATKSTVKAPTFSPSEKEVAQPRTVPYNGGSDISLSGRDDKNNSSALSNNSSHSFPGQEETKITAGGIMNSNNKSSSGSSRHRSSTNSFFGPKETLGRNNSTIEKLLPSSPSCEKTSEVPVVETSTHKLIVKIPNRIEPAQSANGASSPLLSNILESDHNLKDKSVLDPNNEASEANVEPNDQQIESNDQSKNVDGNSTASEKSEVPCSSSGNDVTAKQFLESSTSALNTLIESCVKYSESNAPTTYSGDDIGMNLLASVATREMCDFGAVSPGDSMHGNALQDEKDCSGEDSKSIAASSCDNLITEINSFLSEDDNEVCDTSQLDDVDVSGVKATGTASSLNEVKVFDEMEVNLKKDIGSDAHMEAIPIDCEPAKCVHEGVSSEQESVCMKVNTDTRTSTTISLLENESPTVPSPDVDGRGILKKPKSCVTDGGKMEETISSTVVAYAAPLSTSEQLGIVSRMDFDLNEGFSGHDGKCGELLNEVKVRPFSTPPVSLGCTTSVPGAIKVAAAAKGRFVPPPPPPVDMLRNKGEIGWKGSATTSAFRPVEPRKSKPTIMTSHSKDSISEDGTSKPCRVRFDFDLNVADERLLEDMGCQEDSSNHDSLSKKVNGSLSISHSGSGLDLDLNRIDDTSIYKLPTKSLLSASEVRRDFDLNSGPGFDDIVGEQSSLYGVGSTTLSMNSLSPVFGIRPNSLEARHHSSWLPPSGNSYPSVFTPQRIVGPSSGGPFTPDMYRSSMLSSPSQAVPASVPVPFPSGPYPYQMFPFGTTLPLPSTTYSVGSASTSSGRHFNPPMNSPFLPLVSDISSQYSKKHMLGMHEGSSDNGGGGFENNRKWSRQGFDLNAGPGGVQEVESRDDFLAQRQLYVSGNQTVSEEQGKMYVTNDSVLKRKEPDSGLDRESFRYKQSSWH